MANAKLCSNQIAKAFLDLRMSWHRRFFPAFLIDINIVPSAMPFQVATGPDQFPYKVMSFQISTPISF